MYQGIPWSITLRCYGLGSINVILIVGKTLVLCGDFNCSSGFVRQSYPLYVAEIYNSILLYFASALWSLYGLICLSLNPGFGTKALLKQNDALLHREYLLTFNLEYVSRV